MRARLLFFASTLIALPTVLASAFAGCNNNVILPPGSTDDDGKGGDAPTSSGTFSTGSSHHDAGKDAFPDYEDPGCPNPPPPLEDFQCDPYSQGNGDCMPDEACYIYVQYPTEPCGQEVYGAFCSIAGSGQQGDPCQGAQECGQGLACVVTGSGTQCVELCPLEGTSNCPSGFVCEPIDVVGYGGCL